MAIYHDAYLFSPDDFANFIQQNTATNNDWEKMIDQAPLFIEDSSVLALDDIYGGWERTATLPSIII